MKVSLVYHLSSHFKNLLLGHLLCVHPRPLLEISMAYASDSSVEVSGSVLLEGRPYTAACFSFAEECPPQFTDSTV